MLNPDTFLQSVAALRKHDPTLSDDEAQSILAEIGDTPLIAGGLIYATRGGETYTIPAAVLYGKDYEF